MKKITLLVMSLIVSVVLAACEDGPPNGIEPLKAYEGCDVQRIDSDYVCVWADEFNGETLDLSKWNIEVNGFGGGNNEAQ